MFRGLSSYELPLGLIVSLCFLQSIVSGQLVYNNCVEGGKAALTFDDGPHPSYTAQVLDVLKANNVTATFFINGLWNYESNEMRYRETVKRIYDEGHQLGCHTWTHRDMLQMSEAEMRSELSDLQDYIQELTGVKMTVFRPPYGNINIRLIQLAREYGYDTVMYNVDTEDWRHGENTTASLQAWVDAFTNHQPDASYIGLQHDTLPGHADLAQKTIDLCDEYQIKIVTVAECIGMPMYK